jgi:hypothetical protein
VKSRLSDWKSGKNVTNVYTTMQNTKSQSVLAKMVLLTLKRKTRRPIKKRRTAKCR